MSAIPQRKKGCYPSHPIVLGRAIPLGYHIRNLAPAPADFDGTNGCTSFRMFLNDRLGDCVKAEDGNCLLGLTNGADGTPIVVSDEEIQTDYFQETGGGDSGLDLATDLAWENQNGLLDPGGVRHPCGPYGTVDSSDLEEFANAAYYFRWLKIAIATPDDFMNSNDGDLVDAPRGLVGPVDHCVGICGRRTDGAFKLVTWGGIRWATPAFIEACCGEAWARYNDQDFINPTTGKTFDGFDLPALLSAWQQFATAPAVESPNPYDWRFK